jgi:hypothetical protein
MLALTRAVLPPLRRGGRRRASSSAGADEAADEAVAGAYAMSAATASGCGFMAADVPRHRDAALEALGADRVKRIRAFFGDIDPPERALLRVGGFFYGMAGGALVGAPCAALGLLVARSFGGAAGAIATYASAGHFTPRLLFPD